MKKQSAGYTRSFTDIMNENSLYTGVNPKLLEDIGDAYDGQNRAALENDARLAISFGQELTKLISELVYRHVDLQQLPEAEYANGKENFVIDDVYRKLREALVDHRISKTGNDNYRGR